MPHTGAQDQSRSEHFLQNGGCTVEAQDSGLLDGVVVLIEGEGAGDAIDGAACDGIDDGLLVVVIASSQTGILSSLNAVDNGHGSIVAQRSEAVGVLLAVLSLVCVLKVGVGALCVVCAEVGVLQLGVRCVAFQTIPAVAAQEGNCQTEALSLSQDLTDRMVVSWVL